MVKIERFEIDHWILAHSAGAKHNLAHSYCSAISINELISLPPSSTSDTPSTTNESDERNVDPWTTALSTPLKYGPMKGSETLRRHIAALYTDNSTSVSSPVAESPVSIENILPTPGGSLANFIAIFALIGPGDHVVVQYPTYQQLYDLPASVGAEVSLWRAKEEEGWRLDVGELRGLIQQNTKLIILNNPTNPTGAAIPKSTLQEIVDIAREHSITILSDEIYYPLFHSIDPASPDQDIPPSILTFGYENTIATSALSKAYSLAGLRIGWIASLSPAIIEAALNVRSYALITASSVDEQIASYALDPVRVQGLLDRNFALARHNLKIVQAFIDKHSDILRWVSPVGGPVGFVQFTRDGRPVDDVELCIQLLEKKSVLLVPGRKCFAYRGNGDFAGFVRLGFGNQTADLLAALGALERLIQQDFGGVPVL
ncbi:pyridoxal phosphate-dependent transferase [Aspergillus crustosus]